MEFDGRQVWIASLFDNTTVVCMFLMCLPQIFTTCKDLTFMILNVFSIKRPFRQYILYIGQEVKLKQGRGKTRPKKMIPVSYVKSIIEIIN